MWSLEQIVNMSTAPVMSRVIYAPAQRRTNWRETEYTVQRRINIKSEAFY